MEKRGKIKTFSFKKLLSTILFTVIISVFVGTTIVVVFSVQDRFMAEIVKNLEPDSEQLMQIGEAYKKATNIIEKEINEHKIKYGADYPIEEILLFQAIQMFSTTRILETYIMSLLIGVVSGTIIYILAVQNVKGKQIFIELIIAFVILFTIINLLNIGYEAIINKLITNINPKAIKYSAYIYDLENNNILIPYIIISVVIYLANMLRQHIIPRKLNKELENQNVSVKNN